MFNFSQVIPGKRKNNKKVGLRVNRSYLSILQTTYDEIGEGKQNVNIYVDEARALIALEFVEKGIISSFLIKKEEMKTKMAYFIASSKLGKLVKPDTYPYRGFFDGKHLFSLSGAETFDTSGLKLLEATNLRTQIRGFTLTNNIVFFTRSFITENLPSQSGKEFVEFNVDPKAHCVAIKAYQHPTEFSVPLKNFNKMNVSVYASGVGLKNVIDDGRFILKETVDDVFIFMDERYIDKYEEFKNGAGGNFGEVPQA